MVVDCLQNILAELNHAIDKHSRTLIVSNIELLLNYCTRFYERQFITRVNANRDVLAGFEHLLGDYFRDDRPEREGVPTVRWCAEQLHLSPNYFGDLVKKETGKSAQGTSIEGDRHRQGTHFRHFALDQRGGLFAGVPLPAALHAPVQKGGGVLAQRIPDRQLKLKKPFRQTEGFSHKH